MSDPLHGRPHTGRSARHVKTAGTTARRVSTAAAIVLFIGVLIRNVFPTYYTLGSVALVTGAFVLAGGLIAELTLARRGRRGHGKAD